MVTWLDKPHSDDGVVSVNDEYVTEALYTALDVETCKGGGDNNEDDHNEDATMVTTTTTTTMSMMVMLIIWLRRYLTRRLYWHLGGFV